MNSETKTDKCNKWCVGCEEYTDKYENINAIDLCKECDDIYYNKTGYCGLQCSLGGGCDESC